MYKYALIFIVFLITSCTSNKNITEQKVIISSVPELINTQFEIEFLEGKKYNHPSFAFWIENLKGEYIETIYVTQFVATSKFEHGEIESGKWKDEPGVIRRPATLPYWAHKRNIKANDGLYIPAPETTVPDAVSGATPKGTFLLKSGTKVKTEKFRVLMEINQAWDSNEFWTNNKFQDDKDYFASLQPAIIYAVTIDLNSKETEYFLNPIGHSHPSGKNGKLFTDLTSLTTAKEIAEKIIVNLK